MSFINSFMLLGLFFLAIPIIVHLFNFRKYKKKYFTNVKVLFEILNETDRASKLKKRLLLLTRILAIVALIFAFAKPFFSKRDIKGKNFISIYIDNSMSMESFENKKMLLNKAKETAIQILNNNKINSEFQIITNDFGSNPLNYMSYSNAYKFVENINISSISKTNNDIYKKQLLSQPENNSENNNFYWISDFQKYQAEPVENSKANIIALPLVNNNKKNLYIDSIWVESSLQKLNQKVTLNYRLDKNLDNDEEVLLSLKINNKEVSTKKIKIEKSNSLEDSISFNITKDGWNNIELKIFDENIENDNSYFLSLFIDKQPKVCIYNTFNDNKYLNYALSIDNNFDIVNTNKLDIFDITNSNLIILDRPITISESIIKNLKEQSKLGKNILIIFNQNPNFVSYNKFFKEIGIGEIESIGTEQVKIGNLNTSSSLFNNVFEKLNFNNELPYSKRYFKIKNNSILPKEPILTMQNGNSLLSKYSRLGQGSIYILSSAIEPEFSNLVNSPIFAPLIFQIANSISNSVLSSYFIKDNSIAFFPLKKIPKEAFHILGNNIDVIPAQRIIGNVLQVELNRELKDAGFLKLKTIESEEYFVLALNYLRNESKLEYCNNDELKEIYKNINFKILNPQSNMSIDESTSFEWWKVLLIIAAIFLFLEMIINNFWTEIANKMNLK